MSYELVRAEGQLVVVGDIPTIHYGFKAEHLFAGDGWDGVDRDRSEAAYRRCLANRIVSALSVAGHKGLLKVELIDQPRERSWAEGLDGDDWLEICVEIDEALFQEGDAWIVEYDAAEVVEPETPLCD